MWRLFSSLVMCAWLSGCAGVLHGNSQSVQVLTVCNGQVVPAVCIAQNAKGAWHFQSPAAIVVQKDFSNLDITCKSPFFSEVSVTLPSGLNLSTAGNFLVGGVVGVGVDVFSGSAFAYSQAVRIRYPSCER